MGVKQDLFLEKIGISDAELAHFLSWYHCVFKQSELKSDIHERIKAVIRSDDKIESLVIAFAMNKLESILNLGQ